MWYLKKGEALVNMPRTPEHKIISWKNSFQMRQSCYNTWKLFLQVFCYLKVCEFLPGLHGQFISVKYLRRTLKASDPRVY